MTTEPMHDDAEQANDSDPSTRLAGQLEDARQEIAQMREDILRERADLENQRKRLERERDMARKFANERLLGELLPVVDSLEAGLGAAGSETGPLRQGMELTLKQLLKVTGDNGLVAVDPAGQPFNPDQHQAMSAVESPDHEPGHVVQVYQRGWVLNERLLRPAMVVVAKQD